MIQIASFFGVGFLPKAPGTWGSIAAIPFVFIFLAFGRVGFALFVIAILATFFLGLRATKVAQKQSGDEDPSWVVIDEVVGQWIALLPAAWAIADMGLTLWPAFLAGFLAFRLFDIKKPWLVGWADRRGDALGVMLDDVIAGIFAMITVIALAGIYHGLIA